MLFINQNALCADIYCDLCFVNKITWVGSLSEYLIRPSLFTRETQRKLHFIIHIYDLLHVKAGFVPETTPWHLVQSNVILFLTNQRIWYLNLKCSLYELKTPLLVFKCNLHNFNFIFLRACFVRWTSTENIKSHSTGDRGQETKLSLAPSVVNCTYCTSWHLLCRTVCLFVCLFACLLFLTTHQM